MTKRSLWCLLCLILANVAQANFSMDLLKAYQLALQNNASFSAVKATYQADFQTVNIARAPLLPEFSVAANTVDNRYHYLSSPRKNDKWNTHGWTANITQAIVDVPKWLNFKVAKSQQQIAKLTFSMAEQKLIYDVADKYFAVLKAKSEEGVAKANLQAFAKQLKQAQERFKVGMVAITDLQEARASYDAARVGVIRAINLISVAKENLSLLTNVPTSELYFLDQKMPVKKIDVLDKFYEKQAILGNMQLQQAMIITKMQQQKLDATRSSHLPTISGSLIYQRARSNHIQENEYSGQHSNGLIATLSFKLPIFSGGEVSAKANSAGYALQAGKYNEDELWRLAKVNVRNAINDINTDVEAINAWCQSIISASSSVKATENGYKVGTRTIIDVLNSQSVLYNSQKKYLESRYDFLLHTLKLKEIIGTLKVDDLQVLNKWMIFDSVNSDSITPYCN